MSSVMEIATWDRYIHKYGVALGISATERGLRWPECCI